jgi:hypothetical protein
VRLELREVVARVPDQMLDVVEHEEHLEPSQVSADVLGRRRHALGCTDRERHRRGHGLRPRRRREVDVPRPIAEGGRAARRDLHGESRLAHAARANDRDDPAGAAAQQPGDGGDLG